MAFVPMRVWKVPLKYWDMFSALSELLGLGLGQAAVTMVLGEYLGNGGNEKSTSTYMCVC
jgi:hypothetical protein